jgi:hypothetical protein
LQAGGVFGAWVWLDPHPSPAKRQFCGHRLCEGGPSRWQPRCPSPTSASLRVCPHKQKPTTRA